ncbi:MAG TPA: flagellar type III secretion system pore protein FliP [Mycobacteriales bacterium]|nr:flagellar type III secretion system pore protein FliP [Mycobacteriales bacterium]
MALRLAVLATPVVMSTLLGGATHATAATTPPPVPTVQLTPRAAHIITLGVPPAQTQQSRTATVTQPSTAATTQPSTQGTNDATTPQTTPSVGPSPVPAPAAPAMPGSQTKVNGSGGITSNPIGIAILLGALTLVPAALMTMTAFTRIVIVLGFTRSGLSTQSIPPNQVIIGLSLFLTFFVMGPTFASINTDAVQPYLHGQINATQAYDKGIEPLREFMLKQVRAKDLSLFTDMDNKPAPTTPDQVPTTALIPAFILSELHEAFIIGFVVFLPFLIIDLIVAAALSSLGMMMLPPVLVSLPFKLLLFVAVDGWYLIAGSLMRSFHT